jgi:hypothetical protein
MRPGLRSVVVLLVALAIGSACDQPSVPCLLADAHPDPSNEDPGTPYLVLYQYRPGSESGVCPDPPTDFAEDLYSESYPSSDGGPREVAFIPGKFAYNPDTGQPPDRTRSPTIRGHFSSLVPDATGLCLVEGTSAAQQQIGPSLITYEIPRVDVVATGSALGTEILAEVIITRDSCTRTYDALALWPPVSCSEASDCNPYPAPAEGRPNGSGISPSIPVECKTTPPLAGSCFLPDVDPAGFPYLTGD